MVEDTDAWDGRSGREAVGRVGTTAVEVRKAIQAGDNVREPGGDIEAGQLVFPAGTRLGPGHLGVLASLGMVRVPVFPRARVGVLSTGDELVEGGRPLRPGQIRDSNRRMLLAMVAEANAEAVDLGLAPDDAEAITSALTDGLGRCDAILTSGGVSVGDFDYVKVVLERLSAGSMEWMQIAIRPAKPLAFGTIGTVPVFGLPGNPVSSLVSFELLARPALLHLMGHRDPLPRPVLAIADAPLDRPHGDGRTAYLRVSSAFGPDGRLHVRPVTGQDSHQLAASAGADGLAEVADGRRIVAGDPVPVLPLY
jgi:molybdenum cofactor synthesis domain-containing protein